MEEALWLFFHDVDKNVLKNLAKNSSVPVKSRILNTVHYTPENFVYSIEWHFDLRWKCDIVLIGSSIDGQPLVCDEPRHLSSLNVVHSDAHQVPGRHLAKGAAVGPQP